MSPKSAAGDLVRHWPAPPRAVLAGGDHFRLDDLSGQIQELEDELERTGGEGTQGRRAFVDRL